MYLRRCAGGAADAGERLWRSEQREQLERLRKLGHLQHVSCGIATGVLAQLEDVVHQQEGCDAPSTPPRSQAPQPPWHPPFPQALRGDSTEGAPLRAGVPDLQRRFLPAALPAAAALPVRSAVPPLRLPTAVPGQHLDDGAPAGVPASVCVPTAVHVLPDDSWRDEHER
jgi:hypothetical protein